MLQTHLEMGRNVSLDDAPKIRILIVEKHAAVRRALSDRLSVTPHFEIIASVEEPATALSYLDAKNGQEGCPKAPIVVLFGLQNGTDEQLFKTIDLVEQMVYLSAAVIVLAPFADEVERLLLHQAGVKCYLLKYIDSARLIREIEAAATRGPKPISAMS